MANSNAFKGQGYQAKVLVVILFATGFSILCAWKLMIVPKSSNIVYKDDISQPSSTDSLEASSIHTSICDHTTASYRHIEVTERLARARSLQRQKLISKVCKLLPDSKIEKQSRAKYRASSTLGHGGYFASPESDVVLMSMSKTGSSNLLVLMCIAQGPPCSQRIESPHFLLRGDTQQFMIKLSDKKLKQKLAEYHFVFTTVRNPWKRLVSAWNHRFKSQKKDKWPFSDFIQEFVIQRWENYGPISLDVHWRPQSIQGAFCSVNYDFIGSTETMDEDVSVIIKELGLDVNTALPKAYSVRRPFEKEQVTSLIYNQTWASIDKQTIDKLKLIYAVDFLMFDYPDYPL